MTKVLILNGPPSSGKDSLAEVMDILFDVERRSFKSHLIDLTRAFYDIPYWLWQEWYTTEGKEVPRRELDFLTCREALIFVSETVTKPNFGHGYFGHRLLPTMPDDGSLYVLSDGGFPGEVQPFLDYGYPVVVARLHRDGHRFDHDSRGYLIANQFPSKYPIVFTDEHFINYEKPADLHDKLQQVATRLMALMDADDTFASFSDSL